MIEPLVVQMLGGLILAGAVVLVGVWVEDKVRAWYERRKGTKHG